jgi:hypothetical protein
MEGALGVMDQTWRRPQALASPNAAAYGRSLETSRICILMGAS